MSHASRSKDSSSRSLSRVRPITKHESGSKHDIGYLLNSSGSSSSSTYTALDRFSSPVSSGITSSPRHASAKTKSKERPYECNICQFSFAQRSDRNKHIRTVHYRERPFVCEHCAQTFGEKGNLNKHIRALHEKSRPFKCTECTSQFAFQDGLSRHVSMVHREARPFQCAEPGCDKSFKQKAHAEKHHTSVHQKLRPCVCFCGAAFRENYNMKQHQKAVHNMDPN